MAVGAEDYIDQLLVQKYAQEKVDNHDGTPSMVNPEKMMSAMSDYASMSRNMFTLSQNLAKACSALNAMNVQYKKAARLVYDEYYGEYYQADDEEMEQQEQYEEQYEEEENYEYEENAQYAQAASY